MLMIFSAAITMLMPLLSWWWADALFYFHFLLHADAAAYDIAYASAPWCAYFADADGAWCCLIRHADAHWLLFAIERRCRRHMLTLMLYAIIAFHAADTYWWCYFIALTWILIRCCLPFSADAITLSPMPPGCHVDCITMYRWLRRFIALRAITYAMLNRYLLTIDYAADYLRWCTYITFNITMAFALNIRHWYPLLPLLFTLRWYYCHMLLRCWCRLLMLIAEADFFALPQILRWLRFHDAADY